MGELQEFFSLYKRAEDLRWQGRNEEAKEYITKAIRFGNRTLDATREPNLCQQVVTVLSMCIRLSDGLESAR